MLRLCDWEPGFADAAPPATRRRSLDPKQMFHASRKIVPRIVCKCS
uniref:Uncharacterized protein n=1 Tax=Arundo donax TaxID=35708 RepID=A0A0A9AE03_ARUDO